MIQYHVFVPSLDPELCLSCWDIRVNHADQPVKPQREPEPKAVARRTDPSTSWEAARSVTDLPQRHIEVLGTFDDVPHKGAGWTDEEAFALYKRWGGRQSVSSFRTRRAELVARGLLRDTGERRKGSTGRRMIVWAAA